MNNIVAKMTELEKITYAKSFIDKLAKGENNPKFIL